MRLGPLRLTRQRAVRAVAGLVAAFLFSGNVLAAAGLCATRFSDTHPGQQHAISHDTAAPSDAQPCAQHVADELGSGSTPNHHCPTDDPSAQTRTADVPAAPLMAAIAVAGWNWSGAALQTVPLHSFTHRSEPQPLYAWLQRFRL
jgi:hypothetical protein